MMIKIQRAAKWVGWLYLSMVPLGIMGILVAPSVILVVGDGAATLDNLSQQAGLVKAAVTTAFMVQIVQLFLALNLKILLTPVDEFKASLIVWFTVATMPIALINEMFFIILLSLNQPEFFLATLNPVQQQELALSLFQWHNGGIMIAHIFWGLWLIPMGYLVVRSGYIPRLIGLLLLLAGVSYQLDTLIWIFAPGTDFLFANLFGWAEVLLPLWLIFRGVDTRVVQQRWPLQTV